MKEDYQKALKKLSLFFFVLVSFNEQDCEKQKGPGNSDQWALQFTKQVQKNSSISYVLLDRPSLMISYKVVFSYPKTSANLCKPIYDIVNYSAITYFLDFGKCGKEGEKRQNF